MKINNIAKTALLLVFFITACIKEPYLDVVNTQPKGYLSIVEYYKTGGTLLSCELSSSELIVKTVEGKELIMDLANIIVEQEPRYTPGVIAVNSDGLCMVDGVATKVKYDANLSDLKAIPYYLYLDVKKGLNVFINNGNHFVIKKTSPVLPSIYISTQGGVGIYSKTDYVQGEIYIKDPTCTYWDKTEFRSVMNIRGRGNSTWGMPKKPYKIKLDQKSSIFDMSKDKEWCLLANYCDKSLLRNITAMEISRRLGFSWTPKMCSVDVYLNGSYIGVYSFSEHKKVSSDRIDINLDEGDILFELEQQLDEKVSWTTTYGAPVMFSAPSDPSASQVSFAKQFFKDFETNLWAKNFSVVYDKYIDKESFINNFIIQELTKNVDGNLRKSTFLTLEKDSKLEMYFVWDFDISMGNCDYYGDGQPTWKGWWIKDNGAWGRNNGWYYRLFMDPNFVKDVKKRWIEVYPQLETIPIYIEQQVELIGPSAEKNFKKWDILNYYVWPNAKVTGSYEAEVEWLLDNYKKRLKWLDSEIRKW